MKPARTRIAVAGGAIVASLGIAGAAFAVEAADTTTSVAAHTVVVAPANNPAVFAGTHNVAPRGKPLPSGYAVVGRHVSITRGQEVAYAAMVITCPSGKRLQGLGSVGQIGWHPFNHDVNPRTQRVGWVGQPSTIVVAAFGGAGSKPGDTLTGTVYGLCR